MGREQIKMTNTERCFLMATRMLGLTIRVEDSKTLFRLALLMQEREGNVTMLEISALKQLTEEEDGK